MMTDAEKYFEEHLKGKSIGQLRTEIRGLKNQMGRLKNVMENPYHKPPVDREEAMEKLTVLRNSLEYTKEALLNAGGEYIPSQREAAAADFEENIPYISKIIFNIGGFFSGDETHTADLTDVVALNCHRQVHRYRVYPQEDLPETVTDKEKFLSAVKDLHIEEWLREYNTHRFGYVVCDGTQWGITINYSNGHKPVKFSGSNSYPYNFEQFTKLMGIAMDDDEDEEEETEEQEW